MNKSLIKWLGGKSKLLPIIIPELENGLRYIEPFAGSFVVGLNVPQDRILMNDINLDIVNLFINIKDNYDELLLKINALFLNGNTSEQYYKIRSLFNNTSMSVDRSSMFVYLNKHCFNGLCRYNSMGGFNAAFGKYSMVNSPTAELANINEILHSKDVYFSNLDFIDVMKQARPGDVIYCDPPYAPINETSFVNYSGNGFTLDRQVELAAISEKLSIKGIKIVISNIDTEYTRELYKKADRLIELKVGRSISVNTTKRNKVSELIAIYEPKVRGDIR